MRASLPLPNYSKIDYIWVFVDLLKVDNQIDNLKVKTQIWQPQEDNLKYVENLK